MPTTNEELLEKLKAAANAIDSASPETRRLPEIDKAKDRLSEAITALEGGIGPSPIPTRVPRAGDR